jgi:hypothetical protein
VIFFADAVRPVDAILVGQQRHDMPRTGIRDGFVQAGEGANVDHGIERLFRA